MKKVSIVRGAFLNPFELQNFYPLKKSFDITAISSLHPLNSKIELPLTKLLSPTDLPNFPYKYPVLNRIFTDAHYLLGLEKRLTGSDIVHVAETYYSYTIQSIKAKQRGLIKKIISTCWDVVPYANEGIKGRKQYKKLSYQYIDHFITPTKVAQKVLEKEGVISEKISTIPLGIDLKRFKPNKRKKNPNKINILFVGRATPEKGIDEIINVFKRLNREHNNIKLTIVGAGKLTSHQKDTHIELKQVPYNKIHIEYQKADIFCLPTKQEQYGMSLIEAMASGLAIVTSDLSTLREVCSSSALYSSIGSEAELYQNLKKLISSRNELRKLSQIGLSRAKSLYDYNLTAVKIGSVWQKILEE